jgi:hypothetical protein
MVINIEISHAMDFVFSTQDKYYPCGIYQIKFGCIGILFTSTHWKKTIYLKNKKRVDHSTKSS